MKKMRKIRAFVFAAVILVSSVCIAPTAAAKVAAIPGKVTLDEKEIKSISKLYADGDNIYIPADQLFKALGATVTYTESTKTLDVKKGDISISMTAGSKSMLIHGDKHSFRIAPMIQDGVFYTFLSRTFLAPLHVTFGVSGHAGSDDFTVAIKTGIATSTPQSTPKPTLRSTSKSMPQSTPKSTPQTTSKPSSNPAATAAPKPAAIPPICKNCNGTGRIWCVFCSGGGIVQSWSCAQRGVVIGPCPSCGGAGIKAICGICYGSGRIKYNIG